MAWRQAGQHKSKSHCSLQSYRLRAVMAFITGKSILFMQPSGPVTTKLFKLLHHILQREITLNFLHRNFSIKYIKEKRG